MQSQPVEQMARRRALLTDAEREILSTEEKGDRYYQAVSRIRRKINEQLMIDLALLDQHNEELFTEIESAVGNFEWEKLAEPIDADLLPLTGKIVRLEMKDGDIVQIVLQTASWTDNSFSATGSNLVDSSTEYELTNDERFTPVFMYERNPHGDNTLLGEIESAYVVKNSG